MVEYIPPSSGDTAAAYSLLSGLMAAAADPKATKVRLEQLTKANEELVQSLEQNKAYAIKAEKDLRDNKDVLEALKKQRADLEVTINDHNQTITEKNREIQEAIEISNNARGEAQKRIELAGKLEVALNERKAQLDAKEQALNLRENALANRDHELSHKEAKHLQRIEQLKSIVNS